MAADGDVGLSFIFRGAVSEVLSDRRTEEEIFSLLLLEAFAWTAVLLPEMFSYSFSIELSEEESLRL